MLTVAPVNSSAFSNSGIAVSSLLLSAVLTCAKLNPLFGHHAETRCSADASRLRLPRTLLPSIATCWPARLGHKPLIEAISRAKVERKPQPILVYTPPPAPIPLFIEAFIRKPCSIRPAAFWHRPAKHPKPPTCG
ncbi:hypothetical protein AQ610_00815 [Burkholderia humptydooensis]|nr:hypothetical protein AQ610_00815 [Burkholderia humptydooensis]